MSNETQNFKIGDKVTSDSIHWDTGFIANIVDGGALINFNSPDGVIAGLGIRIPLDQLKRIHIPQQDTNPIDVSYILTAPIYQTWQTGYKVPVTVNRVTGEIYDIIEA